MLNLKQCSKHYIANESLSIINILNRYIQTYLVYYSTNLITIFGITMRKAFKYVQNWFDNL